MVGFGWIWLDLVGLGLTEMVGLVERVEGGRSATEVSKPKAGTSGAVSDSVFIGFNFGAVVLFS